MGIVHFGLFSICVSHFYILVVGKLYQMENHREQYTTEEGWDDSSGNAEASCAQACQDATECDYGTICIT